MLELTVHDAANFLDLKLCTVAGVLVKTRCGLVPARCASKCVLWTPDAGLIGWRVGNAGLTHSLALRASIIVVSRARIVARGVDTSTQRKQLSLSDYQHAAQASELVSSTGFVF